MAVFMWEWGLRTNVERFKYEKLAVKQDLGRERKIEISEQEAVYAGV